MTIARLTDVDLLHPRLRDSICSGDFEGTWAEHMAAWSTQQNAPERDVTRLELHLFETHRPAAEQQKRYETRDAKGRRVTKCDGIVQWSRHQDSPSTAMDLAIKLDGKWTWDTSDPLVRAGYEAIRDAAEALGFESGGRWPMGDYPHVQLWKHDRVAEAQRLLNALGYDCGEVDGIHGRRTDAALSDFVRDYMLHVDGRIQRQGRIHPDEWTALWTVAREQGVA